MWTPESLIAFEDEIASLFERGMIKSPVHLAGGNEAQLIEIFKDVRPIDWVCCAWRSHYHCLLKGVPEDELKQAISDGKSIALCFPEYRIISSAIVGGIAPIAMGIAWGIKRRSGKERVYCFVGDMTARAGVVQESRHYAAGHDLPITWIAEDNGMSVSTNTQDVWRSDPARLSDNFWRYSYQLSRPHVGIGKFVRF